MLKKTVALICACLACGAAPPIALAQTVTVTPKPSPLVPPRALAREEELHRIPGSVALVESTAYDKKFAKDLKDALGKTPGVFAQNRFGEEIRLSIRGSGLSRGFHLRGIELLVDGNPINLADGGGDFQEIDLTNTQYIEVYKGANALQFGTATLGGAINVVTPTARSIDYTTLLRVDGGSFGNLRTHVATGQVDGKWDAYASVTGSVADGFRDQSQEKKGRLNGNVGYKIADNAETRFFVTYNNLNQEAPSAITRTAALDNPRRTLPITRINDYQRDIRSVRLSNLTTIQLTPQQKWESGAFVNDKDLFHPIFQVIDQESTDYGGFTRLSSQFAAFGLPHRTTIGVNYHGGKTDALQFINAGGSRGAQTGDADQKSQNVNLYGEGQFHVSRDVSTVLGGQLAWSKRDFVNNLVPANSDAQNFTQFNPKIGGLWDVTPGAQVFANVSRSSETPTFSELVQFPVAGFVPLDPQKAWTTEIGTRGAQGSVAWDLTAYRATIRDELLQFATGPTIPAATFNADKTVHQGLELGADWRFARDVWRPRDSLTLSQIYNFNDFRFDGDAQFGDNQIAGIPRHLSRTELRYKQEKWQVAPIVEWAPEAPYADFANTLKATDYTVLNLEASYRLLPNVELFFEGRNLLDAEYISNVSTVANGAGNPAIFYPGEGRGFFGGFKATF